MSDQTWHYAVLSKHRLVFWKTILVFGCLEKMSCDLAEKGVGALCRFMRIQKARGDQVSMQSFGTEPSITSIYKLFVICEIKRLNIQG